MTALEELKPRLKAILVERLKLERTADSIGDSEPLFGPDGIGLDSIDALELVLGVEQEFGVRIENEEVGTEALASIEQLARFVAQKQASSPPV
ncbi:MAG: acyl carrier protein [Acidobacteria bacterium]|nr:acyl carrier protein [Acidobacteriota bacterium]MCB9377983.1 acyl carrier protein [Holophagales bacterium]